MAHNRSEDLLHKLFFRSAKNFPSTTAVTYYGDTEESLTYDELNKKVVELSSYFKTLFSPNEMVGVYCHDCLHMPAILLAIMDASAAFYPISTAKQPSKVIEKLIHYSVRYILVENNLIPNLTNSTVTKRNSTFVQILDNDVLQATHFSLLKVVNRNEPCIMNYSKDLAYVMQTSGTTGDPKAVFVPHSCIVPNVTHLSSIFGVTRHDVVYFASPYTFDPSIVQMFIAFHNGAKLLITPPTTRLVPEKLCERLFDQQRVTIFQPTPSLIYYIGEDLIRKKLLSEYSPLSVLAFGGESCPSLPTLKKWKHPNCKTRLYNLYGITEVSSWATCHHITDDEFVVAHEDDNLGILNVCPLGTPLSQTVLIVYDDNGHAVHEKGVGHLWIGGHDRQCLLEGELEENIPVMRDSGDIVRIEDDQLWYLGRCDNQIKRFGHRINLDHIEKITVEQTNVTSCTLVLEHAWTPGTLLHLFAVPNIWKDSNLYLSRFRDALMERLRKALPQAWQPDHVHIVKKLPLTNHGKVDKPEALRTAKSFISLCKYDQSVAHVLSEMWLDCIQPTTGDTSTSAERNERNPLKRPLSGVDCENLLLKTSDMFMLQGGDSFRAVQLAQRIENYINKCSGQSVDLSMLFETITNKTFDHLVSYVENTLQASESSNTSDSNNFNEQFIENKTSKDLVHYSTISKIYKDSARKDSTKLLRDKMNSVRENDMCTCFIRRGSKVFVCPMCRNISKCLVSENKAESSSAKKLPVVGNVSVIWRVFMEECIDASPLVVPSCTSGSSGAVFIGSHSRLFISVALSNGEILWRARLGGRIESSACLSLCGEKIVVGCYDGKIYVLARNNGQIMWTYQTEDVIKSSPSLDVRTGFIWVGSHDHCLYSLDIECKACKIRVECSEGSCFSSPVISYSPHHVYVGSLAGCFLCVDAVSGEIKWLKRFQKPIFSSPMVQDDIVFVAIVNGDLRCFTHYGDPVWTFNSQDPIFSSPLTCTAQRGSIAADVIIASHGHRVYRVSSEGNPRWSTIVDAPVYATPCFASYTFESTKQEVSCEKSMLCVVIATTKGTLYLLNARDGKILETFALPGEVFSSPVVLGCNVVIGCRNDYLYNIKLR